MNVADEMAPSDIETVRIPAVVDVRLRCEAGSRRHAEIRVSVGGRISGSTTSVGSWTLHRRLLSVAGMQAADKRIAAADVGSPLTVGCCWYVRHR